jgi:ubiquinone/menaquinone biosynthesis C-methylase UbiE
MFLRPAEIIQHLKDKKYILSEMKGADFGCGGGYFTVLLSQAVGPSGKIYAIDINEETIKEAQEFADHFGIKNVKFLVKNLENNTGLDNNSLDFVFISQVIYQSDQPNNIIKEAYRILKNNGFLIILEPSKNNRLFLNQKVYDLNELEEFLQNNNFKIIETEKSNDYYLIIGQK